MFIIKRSILLMGIVLFFISELSYAKCTQVTFFGGPVRGGAKSDVNIYDKKYQPEGTTLGYEYVSPQDMASQLGIPIDQVLFRCDLADKDKIYQLYYIPIGYGIDNYTPFGTVDGIGYWKTNMVGLMFNFFIGNGASSSTQFYSNYTGNNSSNIRKETIGYDIDPSNNQKIVIKMKHYAGFTTKQVRSNQAVGTSYVGPIGVVNRGQIVFSGPGINENGTVSNAYAAIPLAMRVIYGRLNNACGISRVTPTVNLGTHSANNLPSTLTNFSVDIECQRGSTKVKYGFVPSEENRITDEQNYLLLDPSSGATAKGVAIEILNSSGARVKLLSLGAVGAPIPTTNNWTPVSVLGGSGLQMINLTFSARYVKYPTGGTVKPGNANSKATFLIDMQ
ncbi:fimbrial protein [Providencia manganoxydans]|uniref:Fimbrial protein n=1 Tax=Providencia manganoxydans TaxID=2923283 RepID=A0ABX7AH21_9GAMM|nr:MULTISPECIES: fimbrial protein [Providencia]MDX4945636.1 fimbrial protein [Providencia manganoxydans]QQO63114.1 fimbrial protein [Providencia manganoxydans]HEF8774022.1 fimbrial protein [Providencia stuartii]